MKPWLLLPPQLAHDLAPIGLQILSALRGPTQYDWRPFEWKGLKFHNRLGLAGGVDKDGARIEDWWAFGPGFIEVGTVTPQPQDANDGKIIDRDATALALWNRMGFPGSGAWAVRKNLHDLPDLRPSPIFVNIGKNRWTANADAAKDYLECIEILGDCADAFVVNISSPNTTGLRDLFQPANFRAFLGPIVDACGKIRRPVLLKLSPDLTDEEMSQVVRTADNVGVEGFVATNTTLQRHPGRGEKTFPNEGGVSGRPLSEISKHTLTRLLRELGSRRTEKLVVSVGGVMTPEDVNERLAMGADLVQVYTALVFFGPWFFERVARKNSALEH